MSHLHDVLFSTLLSQKVMGIVHDVRELAEIIEEEPDLSALERAALLRATRRMLVETDAILAWLVQIAMTEMRN